MHQFRERKMMTRKRRWWTDEVDERRWGIRK
jgi:hypothetical protein